MKLMKKIILIIASIIVVAVICIIVFYMNKDKNQNISIDTTPPIIVLGDTYVVKTGYDKELTDVIVSADDIDPNPKREILGDYDVNTSGEYNLTYKIEDASGNVTTKDFTLKVRDNTSYSEDEITFQDAIKNYKTENTKIGIDVSKWQETIDWKKVSDEGTEFAVLRVAYQNGFDGELLIDPYFEQNIAGCNENNIPTAVYFSSYAKTVDEAKLQAEWLIKYLIEQNLNTISVAFDWENWTSFNKLGLSLTDINNMADIYMNEMNSAGHTPMLYGSKTYLEEVWQNSQNYSVWLANYVSKTTYEKEYKMWQLCQTGLISGISGHIDIDVLYQN